ncbi:MAG: PepSY domain-containing protein [Steroidobacteraceae bacterium]|nr:PepSY domain-containing protein [Steroidobacteraceae bacterium]
MTMNRWTLALTMVLALAAGVPAPGDAQASDRGRGRGGESAFDDRAITLDEAVAQAERRYNARAIRAEEKRSGDRIEYRIRLLGADGRVFEVTIDAGAGRRRD